MVDNQSTPPAHCVGPLEVGREVGGQRVKQVVSMSSREHAMTVQSSPLRNFLSYRYHFAASRRPSLPDFPLRTQNLGLPLKPQILRTSEEVFWLLEFPAAGIGMETRSPAWRFPIGRQSSLHPSQSCNDLEILLKPPELQESGSDEEIPAGLEDNIRLMYLVNEHDVKGIRELLDAGVNVNFIDIDNRTALHVASCQGYADVVQLLLENGADVNPKDRWGSTPLADAIHYKNHEVIRLLEKYGARLSMDLLQIKSSREPPEYEIDPKELDFTESVNLHKGTFRVTTWRGIKVAVKQLREAVTWEEDKVKAFMDELSLFQQIRHPNVVQFLGAVTQSSPMMIITEYLPKGDLESYLKKHGALKPAKAVKFALDIARGMNYLHEHKPEAIIHRDLEPSNILRDDSGHLKVADFGVSKVLKAEKTIKEDILEAHLESSHRYVAPEVFQNGEYDTKADVFSFSLILQEMIEGCAPFSDIEDHEVPKAYASKERPPFRASKTSYAYGLRELIEECWSGNPSDRPTFKVIIDKLSNIQSQIARKQAWKGCLLIKLCSKS